MADYAGDVSAEEAWHILKSEKSSALVDVRTRAEWQYVGFPLLTGLGKEPVFIEWQVFPDGAPNPVFADELSAAEVAGLLSKNGKILFLCRSGVRSRSAAIAATALGFAQSFNISKGFEGDLDSEKHRGLINGWKSAKLPWRQS